jgi:hypothetical protein
MPWGKLLRVVEVVADQPGEVDPMCVNAFSGG